MKDMGIIQGSAAQAVPLIVGKDRVDVHTNITPVTQDNQGNPVEGLFQYHEIQYDKDEYIRLLSEKNDEFNVLAQQTITDLDIANIISEQAITDLDLRILELEV